MPPARCANRRGHKDRSRRNHLAAAAGLVGAAVVSASVLGTSTAAWATGKGSSGTLVLKGYISGTLKVPAFLPPGQILTGCQISPTQGGTVVLQWDSAKLHVNGQSKTLKNIDVQVDVQRFGRNYSMQVNSFGAAAGNITFQSNLPFGWSTVSGAVTTTKSGSSGSASGTMSAGKQHPGTVTIKGNWAGCAKIA
jgi:hypothetical protein